ncbi:MAG: hypothetical protein K1X48_04455 [Burkholderiaceae bacterium]|nr:hypothetical protein [Burkholderiaceae bacterium]
MASLSLEKKCLDKLNYACWQQRNTMQDLHKKIPNLQGWDFLLERFLKNILFSNIFGDQAPIICYQKI